MTTPHTGDVERTAGHTPTPWTYKFFYTDCGVNDGSHKTWTPPASIPRDQCSYCHHELVRTWQNDSGETFHTHRVPIDDFRNIYSADGTLVVGNYDYEEGGVVQSEADAKFICTAVNSHAALVAACEAKDAALKAALARSPGCVCDGGVACIDCQIRAALTAHQGQTNSASQQGN